MKKVLLLLIIVYVNIFANEKKSISVMEFKNSGVDKAVAQQVADAFSASLFETGKYNVLERSQLDQILKEQSLQSSGACSDEACMIEIGQLAGVQFLVVGSIGRLGNSYTINAKLLNVETGVIVSQKYLMFQGTLEELVLKEIPKMVSYFTAVPPTKISVAYDTLIMKVGEEKNIAISVEPEGASEEVSLKVKKAHIADISNSAHLKALTPGLSTVLIKSVPAPNVKTSFTLLVEKPVDLSKVKKKGHGIGYRVFQGVAGVVAIGAGLHAYLLNDTIDKAKEEYYMMQQESDATSKGDEIENYQNEQKVFYVISGVTASVILVTFVF